MPEPPVLGPRLRELDETIAGRGMPLGARARVAERLRQESHRRAALSGFRFRWLPALTFAAGAALVLVVVGFGLRPRSPATPELAPSAVLGGFAVEGEGCRHRVHAGDTVLDGTCRLVAPHMAVHTWDRAVLREDEGVRVVEGTALFDVSTVVSGADPIRIHVSHGTIEVIGTRFTIEQGPTGGHVDLFEGRIRFVSLDGAITEIEPGQRHWWGAGLATAAAAPEPEVVAAAESVSRPGLGPATTTTVSPAPTSEPAAASPSSAVPEPSTAPRPRAPSRPRATRTVPEGDADEATAIIEEVTQLRTQGRYLDAAAVLRRAEASRRWDHRTAQVLSYELGQIIERHLGDPEAACRHWARHQQRFVGGRYSRAVTEALARLSCSPPAAP